MLLFLFYYRTYVTQNVAAAIFDIGQASVSRTIDRLAPLFAKCLPTPKKMHTRAKRISTVEELDALFPES